MNAKAVYLALANNANDYYYHYYLKKIVGRRCKTGQEFILYLVRNQ